MKDWFKIIMGILAVIILFLALDFGFLKWFVFIAPQKEDARREVFLNTRSYKEGKMQDLLKLRFEHMQASPEDKPAIESTVRHMFAEFDENAIKSVELQRFLKNIKYGDNEL